MVVLQCSFFGQTFRFVTILLASVGASALKDQSLRGRKEDANAHASIQSHGGRKVTSSNTVTVVYPPELPYSSLVTNPERGFYWQDSYYASSAERLDASDLAAIRTDTGMTVMLRLYYLDDFLYGNAISQSVLDDIEADFDMMRTAGVKAVLRFAYVNSNDDPSVPTEPTKDEILFHVAQLTPILMANQDAIIAIQAGFIGPWGEWHSSTHFDDDWEGRGEIVTALLDSVPDRIVQIRTPLQKQTLYETAELPEPTTGYVTNGEFEGPDVESNWNSYSNGYTIATDEAHSGTQSIAITNGGARQWVSFEEIGVAGPGSTIKISGFTKSVGTSVGMGGDYAIYADVAYDGGSYLWGQVATFEGGTSTDWEMAEYSFVVPEGKTVIGMNLYAMYRNDVAVGGMAYFDDLQVIVYGPSVSTGGGALDSTSAYSDSHIARTGHHNDCFLASDTDFGTYTNSDGNEYPYLSQDTKYTAMGGETCNVNPPRSECVTALSELQLFHYSYLNSGYNANVLNSWTMGGCMKEVTAKLGYRLILQTGTFPINLEPGGNLPYEVLLENAGYSSPINPKRVQLVLRESSSGSICAATDTSTDIRTWYGGESHTLQGTAVLPQDIAIGTYDLYLNIADSSDTLKTRLEFKVGVANSGNLNEIDTGLIDLQHSIQVVANGGSSFPAPQNEFQYNVVCGIEAEIVPPAPPATNPESYVTNGSFEAVVSLDWAPYMDGYEVITGGTHSGAQSVEVTNGGGKQTVYVNAPKGSTITLSGFSKAVGVTANLGSDYSIYADVKYTDGSYLWGQRAEFTGTLTDWEYSEYSFEVIKPVEKLSLYVLYRNDPANGIAVFDDIEVLVDPPLVQNGGFEGDVSTDWNAYSNGYSVSSNEAHTGDQSILVNNGAARQWVSLTAESGSSVTISGYSKSVETSVGLWDYSIYADVAYDDNTNLWGQKAKFTGGSTDWEFAEKTFVVPEGKTVVGMTIYTMYRNDPAEGSAYFDDIRVTVN